MSLATIRSQIKTEIETIVTTSIGTVYDYKRYSNDWVTYKNLFIRDSKVHTWEIERLSFERTEKGGSGGAEFIKHDFVIRGFYSFDDKLESDKVFQDSYVELICQEFMNNPNLGGVADIINMPISGTLTKGMLGEVLCHIAEILISVTERRIF